MKTTFKWFGVIALVAVIGFLAACGDPISPTGGDDGKKPVTVNPAPGPNSGGGDKPSGNGEGEKEKEGEGKTVDYTAASVADLEEWLAAQPVNTADKAYKIALTIDEDDFISLRTTLLNAADKYVYLDLSGSAIASIPDLAFVYCTSLASITIPTSVTSIGNCAFYYCDSLTSFTIPNSVTNIGTLAFSGCTGLTEINVDSGNTSYSSDNGILYNKNKTTLIQYPSGKMGAFTVPDNVTSIGNGAFQQCTGLTGITIPKSRNFALNNSGNA